MSFSPLEMALRHNGRLDVLCCLLDDGPLVMSQLITKTGEPFKAVRYWLRGLESFGLVEKLADPAGGEPLHSASLDEQPAWVHYAIEYCRARRRLDSE
jgi:predicted transcriptional regulator